MSDHEGTRRALGFRLEDGGFSIDGLVVGHTHLYSTLARGMPGPAERPERFSEILERVWWRLDRALDLEAVRISARVGIAEAVRAGATCIIDHHESPSAIEGSLDAIADEMQRAGVRGAVCYGATARNGGEDEWRRGLAECERFIRDNRRPLVRGLVGLHACFTLPDEALRAAAETARRLETALHVHVAEGLVDRDALPRLERAGALIPGSVFAHGVHLHEDDVRRIAGAGVFLAQNARSNMGNAVGFALHDGAEALGRALLGTDGWDGDVLLEARALAMRAAEAGETVDVAARLAGGRRLAEALFGDVSGDRTRLAYDPPTPLDDVVAHLLSGGPRVAGVLVSGREPRAGYDAAEAREAARRLWARMAEVRP